MKIDSIFDYSIPENPNLEGQIMIEFNLVIQQIKRNVKLYEQIMKSTISESKNSELKERKVIKFLQSELETIKNQKIQQELKTQEAIKKYEMCLKEISYLEKNSHSNLDSVEMQKSQQEKKYYFENKSKIIDIQSDKIKIDKKKNEKKDDLYLKSQFLFQYANDEEFASNHSPQWVCETLYELVRQKKLSPNEIENHLKILKQTLRFLNSSDLDLVDQILFSVENFRSLTKFEILSHLLLIYPNRKSKLMKIFFKDLKLLILSRSSKKLDFNFQMDYPHLYLKIKQILEIANYSIYRTID